MEVFDMEHGNDLISKCESYLNYFCNEIAGRAVGSEGNRLATKFFEKQLDSSGWKTEVSEFDAIDWIGCGAELAVAGESFEAFPSPYSIGCDCRAELVAAGNIRELGSGDFRDKVILLHGEIAKEQLMPKNFVFYNPEEHRRIISFLESSGALALICATGRNAALAGGVYPFPLIEDGDFDIPSVYMTEEEGRRLINHTGEVLSLRSESQRTPGTAENIMGTKGNETGKRIVITAHIDSKKGTPGAIDNATGVIVLLLLAELLKDYDGKYLIELVAFNGEDYYSVPGQMNYIMKNQDKFGDMVLNINIDGAGYFKGKSSMSLFDLPEDIREKAESVLSKFGGIAEGQQWPQGDHSIFIQYGVPAIAFSSKWFIDNIDVQDITHTPKDKPDIVDCGKSTEIAEAIKALIMKLG